MDRKLRTTWRRWFALIALACGLGDAAAARAQDAGAWNNSTGAPADEGPSELSFAEPPTARGYAPATPLISYSSRDAAAAPAAQGNNPLRPADGSFSAGGSAVEDSAAARDAFAETAPVAPYSPPANTPLVVTEPESMRPQFSTPPQLGAAPPEPHGVPRYAQQASAETEPPAAPIEEYDSLPLPAYQAPVAEAPAAIPAAPMPSSPMPSIDAIVPAGVTAPPANAADPSWRRLAPPSAAGEAGDVTRRDRSTKYAFLPTAFSQLKSFSTAGMGLAIVITLFVVTAWLLRRGPAKPTGVLPAEAFSVLGRAPLTAQSFAQLLRLGNKLVLVAVTPDGAQTLAEVTDPAEVDRIAGLCVSNRGAGPSAEFQQVLAQLSREPAKGFLGREGSSARRRA
jgi:flagellar protein FliO/FliZ